METVKSDNSEPIGSVKAAISLFGERINGKNQEKSKNLEVIEWMHDEKHNQFAQQFEAANMKSTEFQGIRKSTKSTATNYNSCSEDAIIQLDKTRRELRKLQLEVKNAIEAKRQSERKAETSALQARLGALKAEEIKRRIEEANEEHVIVELARIEAERETREIEARRESETDKYRRKIESLNERMDKVRRETDRARELEERLDVAQSDVAVLQNEMQLVRAMEINNNNTGNKNKNKDIKDEIDKSAAELKKTEAELESARNEMEKIKGEGFEYMAYMDRTRGEILGIREEIHRMKEKERKDDLIVERLNSKLLKARSKLEAASASDERTKTIVASLQSAFDQMRSEVENANKKKELVVEETNRIRAKTERIFSERDLNEERGKQLVKELRAAKASERVAMKRLKSAVERTVVDRVYVPDQRKGGNTVTISRSEYEYLINGADSAKSVAERKVEACRAWVDAIRSAEKEIKIRIDLMRKEAEELKAIEDQTVRDMERNEDVEREMYESMNACVVPPKNACLLAYRSSRPARERRASITAKGVKVRRVSVSSVNRVSVSSVNRVSVSSVNRGDAARPPSITIKRKKKKVTSLIKFMRRQRRLSATSAELSN